LVEQLDALEPSELAIVLKRHTLDLAVVTLAEKIGGNAKARADSQIVSKVHPGKTAPRGRRSLAVELQLDTTHSVLAEIHVFRSPRVTGDWLCAFGHVKVHSRSN
jgi:hypothetical protein